MPAAEGIERQEQLDGRRRVPGARPLRQGRPRRRAPADRRQARRDDRRRDRHGRDAARRLRSSARSPAGAANGGFSSTSTTSASSSATSRRCSRSTSARTCSTQPSSPFARRGAGREARAQACSTGSRARTSRSAAVRLRLDTTATTLGAWTPTASGGCASPPSSSRRSSVFVALRNESREDLEARPEPVLALVCLAGIAVALGTSTARTLYDNPRVRRAPRCGLGGDRRRHRRVHRLLHRRRRSLSGARGLGSVGSFQRARHILGFAVAPLALSLFLLWPVQLALFGTDRFRRYGSDDGAAGRVFDAARARLRALVGRAAARRRPRRARLELVALARRARARRPLPSGVLVPPHGRRSASSKSASSSSGIE